MTRPVPPRWKPKWYDVPTPRIEGWVLDIGSGGNERHEASPRYCSMDVDRRFGPTLLGDAHHLPFKDGALDGVIALSVLEHVAEPAAVVREIRRILKARGLAHVLVPFMKYRHDAHDYLRWTEEGLRHLLRDFRVVHLERRFCGLLSVVFKWLDSGAYFFPSPLDRFFQGLFRALLTVTSKVDVGKDRFYESIVAVGERR